MSSQGSVITRVYTSDALLPLRDVPVIYTAEGTSELLAIRYTDGSGLTQPLYFETPDASVSLSPGSAQPFALVNISVSHPGYSSATAENVQIFPGVQTIQAFQLQPVTASGADSSVTLREPVQNL